MRSFANPDGKALAEATELPGVAVVEGRFSVDSTAKCRHLHEGADFTLIGRFAKGGMSCDFTAAFSDGFES